VSEKGSAKQGTKSIDFTGLTVVARKRNWLGLQASAFVGSDSLILSVFVGSLCTLRRPWGRCTALQAFGMMVYRCMDFAHNTRLVQSGQLDGGIVRRGVSGSQKDRVNPLTPCDGKENSILSEFKPQRM
jgi:hypothetical protein